MIKKMLVSLCLLISIGSLSISSVYAASVDKSFADISPEQEYYIGRTVAASIVNVYSIYTDEDATYYLNLLGQTLARASDKPETFNGYHFLIINSEEINAFAAPSGFIFISKGMIRLCKSEDDLAAVLAHEIGHIQHLHALKAISADRITTALSIRGSTSLKNYGPEGLAKLASTFESTIDDISQSINQGYSRQLELEADSAAIAIMRRVGYHERSLISVLQRIKVALKTRTSNIALTHPAPGDRIAQLQPLISVGVKRSTSIQRKIRFTEFLESVFYVDNE